jgi:hypothetical protein
LKSFIKVFIVLILLLQPSMAADVIARISRIEGKVSILRASAESWLDAKPAMPLEAGDQIYTREESFAEIRYAIGTVLRMDEKTKITIEASSEKTVKTRSAIGDIWVNMKKIMSKGKEFEVSSPTAVAAIRGTIFRMSCSQDSTSVVSVYNGRVAVGPSDVLKRRSGPEKQGQQIEKPVEVPGPEEIPGPFEVSLDQWREIVAGQEIAIRRDGKFKQEQFDLKAAAREEFVKKNLALDKEL